MKKLYISGVFCLIAMMAMSQYVQGTIVQNASAANVVNILGQTSTAWNLPIKEFDFVVSIPSASSSGVTATLSSSTLDAGSLSNWLTTTPSSTTANGRTYYAFHYYNQGAATNFSFGAATPTQLASVTFTGALSSVIRSTDENSDVFVNKWYIAVNGDPGADGSGEISTPSTSQVYYATPGKSAVTTTSGAYQYVETSNTILPITLANFTATKAVGKVNIAWATAKEDNSASFLVQRSSNGIDFVPVTSVVAVGTGANKYAVVDASPLNGTNFYRLKNIDKDGTFAYSGIVSVNFDVDSKVSVYPSPAHEFIKLNITNTSLYGTVSQLVDFGGRTIQSFTITGNAQQVNVSNLATGMYFVKLADGSNVKFVKN